MHTNASLRGVFARRLYRLSANADGVTTVEFAFIAPVFLLLVMGIIEFSLIMFTNAVMESATMNTSRLGKTGYVDPAAGTTRTQQIIQNVHDRTAGLLTSTLINIDTKVYSAFDKVNKPEPCISPPSPPCGGAPGVNYTDINGNGAWDADMGASGQGASGDVVVYTVSYPWPVMTPVLKVIIGNTFNITTRSVVKNEPF